MRTTTNRVLLVALLISAALSAQDGPRGRWTGSIDIPGHTAAVEIDLDKTAKGWVGSMALPVQKASGIPLEAIAFADGKWTFRIKGLPEAPTFTGTLSADGLTLSGDFAQGDASFPFQLSRAGDAQVAATKPSPAVPREFLGTWEGTLLDQGVPKRMVFKIANDESGASAVLISVKVGAEIPVATIEQKDAELKLSVQAVGGEYWGEINQDGTELSGSWTQSGNNLPLKFKKKAAEPAKTEMRVESPDALTSSSQKQSPMAAQNLPLPAVQQKQAEPPPALPSKPLSAEHEKIVADARAIALDYSRRLPDFICLQLTRRYDDPLGESGFVLQDTVAAQLTYFEQKEDYKVISRKANYKVAPKNDKWTGSSYTRLDGVTSSGEFGTLLKDIFEPRTHADFWFQRRGSLHRHVTLIFGYRVPARNSKWRIEYNPGALVCTTEYTGSLFIDPETHAVMRVSMEARRIPTSFPVQDVWIQLDYAWQDLAGEKFLLPSTVVLNMREGRVNKKNEIDFRSYRKYSAASAVTFEADSAGAINAENDKDKQQSTRPRQ
ncbi:MAG: hypothetical protein ABSE21_11520 [Bryobacteraceae bacterium]|jgi:hypothetical protein